MQFLQEVSICLMGFQNKIYKKNTTFFYIFGINCTLFRRVLKACRAPIKNVFMHKVCMHKESKHICLFKLRKHQHIYDTKEGRKEVEERIVNFTRGKTTRPGLNIYFFL